MYDSSVVDRVDAREVVHRLAVDLAVDTEVVAEDAVRPHRLDAQLVVHPTERLTQLGADRAPADLVL
jgi:O-acetylhomoserine/O-acetylserine sulfhydrylase-like pyridoxal-dependent enzyme